MTHYTRCSHASPGALVIHKEENLVKLYRPAKRGAELVLLQSQTVGKKEIAGVESIVAQVVECIATKLVGPAFQSSVLACVEHQARHHEYPKSAGLNCKRVITGRKA